MHIGIYAGSFDPPTLGHIDILKRASRHFDRLVVCVARNTSKQALFSADEKMALLQSITAGMENVEIEQFEGLLVTHAKARGASALVRGIRTFSDFEYEFRMALTNRQLEPTLETVFLMTDGAYAHQSSSLIKEIAMMGGDISAMVPEAVRIAVQAKYQR